MLPIHGLQHNVTVDSKEMYVPALQIFGMDLHCVVGVGVGVGAVRGRDAGSCAFESKNPAQRWGQFNLRSRFVACVVSRYGINHLSCRHYRKTQ